MTEMPSTLTRRALNESCSMALASSSYLAGGFFFHTAEARVDKCEKVAAIAGPGLAATQGSSSESAWQGPRDVRTGLACGLMRKHGKALRDPVRPAVLARRKRSAIRPRFIRFQYRWEQTPADRASVRAQVSIIDRLARRKRVEASEIEHLQLDNLASVLPQLALFSVGASCRSSGRLCWRARSRLTSCQPSLLTHSQSQGSTVSHLSARSRGLYRCPTPHQDAAGRAATPNPTSQWRTQRHKCGCGERVRVASKSSSDDGGCSGDFLGRLFVALSGRFSPGDAQGIRRGRAAPAPKKKGRKSVRKKGTADCDQHWYRSALVRTPQKSWLAHLRHLRPGALALIYVQALSLQDCVIPCKVRLGHRA
ncbi:hypothetical protein L1887_51748 [Cichorium endivia]|nr:hypothetical protein L1887_51748 [Cichorium endivia]